MRNNKRTTLESYVKELNKDTPSTPIKGVASYSKIFAIADLEKYAIYDARVAVSLNAIQWNAQVQRGVIFNYVSGRNNVTGHAGKKIGFAHQTRFKSDELVRLGWNKIPPDKNYESYLATLQSCLQEFPKYKLYDLEMVLFANAEKECKKAIAS